MARKVNEYKGEVLNGLGKYTTWKKFRSGGLRHKIASWSGVVPLFLRISETKGFTFLPVSKTFFYEALSPHYGTSLLGTVWIKGNVLRGG